MEALKNYTALIEKELAKDQFPENPAELYDPLRYFLALGGKRIRPVLTLLSAELFGSTAEKALPQALAIEIFHNFTLIHDDIMDEAPTRRKMPTVHEKWNTNIAILSGDVLLIKAYQSLAQVDADKLPEVLEVFNTTSIEVCEGQQMDMNFEDRMDVSISEYVEMIRLKTSVLLGGALEIGDRLVRVGHCQHHIVEVAFIHDVHVLEGAGDGILAGFLAAACYCDDACNAGGQ